MNDELFNNEKVINLKDMLFYICKRWRSVLIGAVVCMLAAIAVKISSLLDLNGFSSVLKQTLKYLVIGLIIGLVVMAVFYAFAYIFSGKIKSESEFKSSCKLSVLGVLPRTDVKRNNVIDRFVKQVFGITGKAEDFDALADRLAEEIKAVLSVSFANDDASNTAFASKNLPCVSVVSSLGSDVSDKLAGFLNKKLSGTAKIVSAGDILSSAVGVRSVMESQAVIVTEKIGASGYERVEEAAGKLVRWDRNVLGVVLVDGDAV